MKILCIGEEWRGSNASGLFYALSRIGHQIVLVNELNYISVNGQSLIIKALNRLIRILQIRDFNHQIERKALRLKPDLVLIYKGSYILPQMIKKLKGNGLKVINFYPDVSLFSHGGLIPKTIWLYDHVFTTKTFAINDLKEKFNYTNVIFIPHGFDPEIHRKLAKNESDNNSFQCDVSFIGTWSPKKEKFMAALILAMPDVDVKIWGEQWKKTTDLKLSQSHSIQGYSVMGDSYALAINSSTINLGILSEQVDGASSGDKITSRTFHIPASSGFMLHERTKEVANYFIENEEMACFEGEEELIEKTQYYLLNNDKRNSIKKNGYLRAVNEHSLDNRARNILKIINEEV